MMRQPVSTVAGGDHFVKAKTPASERERWRDYRPPAIEPPRRNYRPGPPAISMCSRVPPGRPDHERDAP